MSRGWSTGAFAVLLSSFGVLSILLMRVVSAVLVLVVVALLDLPMLRLAGVFI